MKRLNRYTCKALSLLLPMLTLPAALAQTLQFHIPAQSADSALTELARQANTTLLFPYEVAQSVTTNSLVGEFTLTEALETMLADTPLKISFDGNGQISVQRKTPEDLAREAIDKDMPEATRFDMERIAVVGTRSSPRTVTQSPVPLDIVSADSLNQQGSSDVLSMLSTVIPSLNVNDQPINDATSLVRPANLRGMAADHTLVLLNGKRRHRSAVITFLGGGLSDGAQGPDISVLPAAGLKQVEVLRDGAAAQYGSDAIAGVINLVMQQSDHGTTVRLNTGSYYEGDGEMLQLQINSGFSLWKSGFLNITGEYRQQQPTSRTVQRDDAASLIEAGNTYVSDPAQVWGALKVNHDYKLGFNAGVPLSSKAEFYTFGNLAKRDISGGFYYRHPHEREGVFSSAADESGRRRLLIADLDGVDNGIECPTIYLTPANILDDPDYQRIANNGTELGANCFAFNEWFPGGFTPRFGGVIKDASVFTGVRYETESGWLLDISGSLGYSHVAYRLSGTVNPSLGPDSPLTFSPGSVAQIERTLNVDVSRQIQTVFDEPVNFAAGAEWRKESYHQREGDAFSWQAGQYALEPETGLSQGFSIGSNGFPGYQPQSAGHWSRHNWALYTDIEMYVSPKTQVAMAVRVEEFSDFGSTFDGKISGRYEVNDTVALRSSLSTGFKAPTVGQSNVINVTTAYAAQGLEDQATLPPTDLISQQLGATPLTPEESVNTSVGLVAEWDAGLYLTIDYFNIRLRDRISTTSAIPLTEQDIQILTAKGRADAANYKSAKYFTNDFDTTTQGVDVVFNATGTLLGWQQDFIAAYNWTDTRVDRVSLYPVTREDETVYQSNLTPQRIRMLEDNLPAHRATLSLKQSKQAFSMLWRVNYFGSFYEDHLDASAGMDIVSDARVTVETEFAWQVNPAWRIALGAKNLFDTRPQDNPYAGVVGAQYPPTSPSGINGGFYYLHMQYVME